MIAEICAAWDVYDLAINAVFDNYDITKANCEINRKRLKDNCQAAINAANAAYDAVFNKFWDWNSKISNEASAIIDEAWAIRVAAIKSAESAYDKAYKKETPEFICRAIKAALQMNIDKAKATYLTPYCVKIINEAWATQRETFNQSPDYYVQQFINPTTTPRAFKEELK